MKKIFASLWVFPVLLLAAMPAVQAHESALSTMAGMVMHLNHYPSADEKSMLAGIAADAHATAGEKLLAGALSRMQHQVGGTDTDALRALSADKHASKDERTLAGILLGISHHASGADKEQLKALL